MLDMQRQHNHPNISRLHFAVAERQCGNPNQYRLSPPKSNSTPTVICMLWIQSQPLGCAPWDDYYVSGVHRLKADHR